MEKILRTKDNQLVSIKVPPPANISSFFVFALPKSGSVLQDKVFEDICHELNIPLISVAKSAFHQGVEESNFSEEICELFAKYGYGFYGFRYFPPYLKNLELSTFKKILLIRDPRDILVSHYFSMKNSHDIPQGEMGERLLKQRNALQNVDINKYVIAKAPTFLKLFRSYSFIKNNSIRVFKYEDIIFEKVKWIENILTFLEFELDTNSIITIARRHDIFPAVETPQSHIRKVTPGDHQEKLERKTIQTLNEILASILIEYNYEINDYY